MTNGTCFTIVALDNFVVLYMEVILRLFKKSILLLFVFSCGFLSAQSFAGEFQLFDSNGLVSPDFIGQRVNSAVALSKAALGATKSNDADVSSKKGDTVSSKGGLVSSSSVSKEVKNAKKAKTKSLSVKNSFSHSVASDNKRFGYALTISGSMILPKKISLSSSVGFHNSYHYDETHSFADGTDYTSEGVDDNIFDGSPISTTVARSFKLPKKINLSTSFTWVLPVTSKYTWRMNIYSILVPSLGLSRSFKTPQGVAFSLSYNFSYSHTLGDGIVYGKDTFDGNASYAFALAVDTLSNSFSLSTSYKKVTLSLSTAVSSGRKAKTTDKTAKENGSVYQEWNHSISYSMVVSYPYKDFSFSAGVSTAGPIYESGNYKGFDYDGYGNLVRRKNVKGMLLPFDARYTRVLANIGYRFGF